MQLFCPIRARCGVCGGSITPATALFTVFATLLPHTGALAQFAGQTPASATTAITAFAAPSGPPLSVSEAMQLAERSAPGLDARQASADMATAMSESVRALPDPKLKFGIDNLNFEGEDRFTTTRDFMTMRRIGISRDMPRAEKRELKSQRFQIEAQREAAMREDARLMVRRDAALAWIERHYAETAAGLIDELQREARIAYDVLIGQVRAGSATPIAAVAAQSQVRAIDDRRAEFARMAARARAQLERWLGAAAARPLAGWNLASVKPQRTTLLAEGHPHLAAFALAETQADNDIAQAKAQEKADWGWELAYQARGRQFTDMVSFGIVIDLPAFGQARIAPEVRARQAQREAAERNREDARRQHELEVKLALADWDAANTRRANFDDALLPLARDRIDQTLAQYKGGAGKLADVLEARRNWLETRLAQLQLEQDAARAWAQLQYFDHAAHGAALPGRVK